MSAKYIPIMEVVAQFLDEYDKSVGDEDKAWGMAFRGLELMHFNTAAEPKTVMLPILGNKTALLPSDYVNWNKVGIRGEDGKVLTLIINDALTEYKDLHPDRLSQITADVNNGSYSNVWLNWWSDGIYQPLFGLGYGVQNFGECRVDEKNNLIIFDPNFKYSGVLLEYISCPEKDHDYKVDRRLREALITFIAWKFKLATRADFYAAYVEGDRMMYPFNAQEWNQLVREGNKFCLKL